MKKIRSSIVFKSLFGLVLLLISFSAIASIIGYNGVTEVLLNQYAAGAFTTANTASELIDANYMDDYANPVQRSERYNKSFDALQKLCNSQGVTFIYVIQPDLTDYAHITFLISTINDNSPYEQYPFGYVRETTNDDYKQKYRLLYEGQSDQELVIRDKGYIETDPHITALIPLKDSKGVTRAILCVQRQMDTLVNARKSFVHKIFILLFLSVVLIIIGQGTYLNKMVLTPLMKISQESERFAKENEPADTKLRDQIKNQDEIGVLAGSIDQMEEQIQDYIIEHTRITEDKQKVATELQLANRIQMGMLPDSYPAFPERNEFDIFATMDPARDVGGDFYNYFLIDEDHLCMMIADVSGKGIPAALYMMSSMIILANNALHSLSPAEILERSNKIICMNNNVEMFVTVWLGILEISSGRLTAASAGHEYPVIKAADGPFELLKDKHGFVLGGMEGLRYKEYELLLQPGAKVFVYTDGLAEANNAKNEMFGTDRIVQALNKDPEGPVLEVMENVFLAVSDYVGDEEQFDDLTMLCLEYRG